MNNVMGGNIVKKIALEGLGIHVFSENESTYTFYVFRLEKGASFREPNLKAFSLFVLQGSQEGFLEIAGTGEVLASGEVINVSNKPLEFIARESLVSFLVAGVLKFDGKPHYEISRYEKIKKVMKPWGHELWLSGEHSAYALKQIFIKAGTRTSLQYHQFKQETNVLFGGEAYLHFKSNDAVSNDTVAVEDLGKVLLSPVTSIDVVPNTLHRLEAVTDILLCETSTPHLDDVIRVSDDTQRTHGRIQEEHRV